MGYFQTIKSSLGVNGADIHVVELNYEAIAS